MMPGLSVDEGKWEMHENHCEGSCPPPRKRDEDDKWFELVIAVIAFVLLSFISAFICFIAKAVDAGSGHQLVDWAGLGWVWLIVELGLAVFTFGVWAVRQFDIWWDSRRGRRY